jgi:dipeptidyl aminopeptidase/acylaminoacyl peptidase
MPCRPLLPAVLCVGLGWFAGGPSSAQRLDGPERLDGVPPIPAGVHQAVNRYRFNGGGSFQGWLAGTRRMLFLEYDGVHLIWDSGRQSMALTSDPRPIAYACSNPGRERLLLSVDNDGDENHHLELYDLRTGPAGGFTTTRSGAEAPLWSHSGQLLALTSNARNDRDRDLYVVRPPHRSTGRRLWKGAGTCIAQGWSPDDRRLAAVAWPPEGRSSQVLLIDVTSGQVETIPSLPGRPAVRKHVRWSADGRSLYWLTDRDSDFTHLARYDLAIGRETTIGPPPGEEFDVDFFDLSTDGALLVYRVNQEGWSRPHLLDLASGRERPLLLPLPPDGLLGELSFRPRSQELTVSWCSARSATVVGTYEVPHHWWTSWVVPWNQDPVDREMGNHEPIRYPTFDGRLIPAFVRRPSTRFEGRRPVLIVLHGGPADQYRPGFSALENVLLGELGIALVMPNVRGSSGYGRAYEELDDGRGREGAVRDVGALLDWIAGQPNLDASRVAVSGESYGGFLALASLARYGDRLRAGIDVMGVSDTVSFLETARPRALAGWRREYGDERDPAMRAFLHEISPLTHADRIRCPLLVIHGRNDLRVRFDQSERLVDAVKPGGRPLWFVAFGGEGHGIDRFANGFLHDEVQVHFLNRYLLEHEVELPVAPQ